MAVEFNGGVIIGADSRTTTGAYVANRVTDKLTRITDKIYCCRSGSAADTQAIADIVGYSLNYHEYDWYVLNYERAKIMITSLNILILQKPNGRRATRWGSCFWV